MTILTATFDGRVFKPDVAPDLNPNTRVRITVEEQKASVPQTRSFLHTARSLGLDGPADWSSRLDEHLYGEMLEDGD